MKTRKCAQLIDEAMDRGDPGIAAHTTRFFKTGPGQYGEGDRFLGIRVPVLRRLARGHLDLSVAEVLTLLNNAYHEIRLLGVLIWVYQFPSANPKERKAIYEAYLNSTDRINNWDLIDVSAPHIVGRYLLERPRGKLRQLARSTSIWEKRIAILATFAFIRQGEYEDTLEISRLLINDEHDLIHKATGWMLREVGKRNREIEEAFLDEHACTMPRTMLRYAIEHLPEKRRQYYLEAVS
jgi:3-methyladenine DNA glycosylase AlkD